MLTVDYSFYSEVYQGTAIRSEEWPEYARSAAVYLNAVTFGRASNALPSLLLDNCRMALCAVADADFQQDAGGEVASASNDGYSETYANADRLAAQRGADRLAAMDLYLPRSHPLRYAGVM